MAAGASEQASALEETATSLETLSAMTKRLAERSREASALVGTATSAATGGAGAMQQMSGAMIKIRASAEGTSEIIKDINEIAFQTHLLALDAAGEAGRGFAVVAEEVRSLALRSKEAEELSGQAQELASTVGSFRVDAIRSGGPSVGTMALRPRGLLPAPGSFLAYGLAPSAGGAGAVAPPGPPSVGDGGPGGPPSSVGFPPSGLSSPPPTSTQYARRPSP